MHKRTSKADRHESVRLQREEKHIEAPIFITAFSLWGIFFKNKFIYLFVCLFMAALCLLCCTRAFSSCGERGLLFIAVCRLLIVVASLVVEHGL